MTVRAREVRALVDSICAAAGEPALAAELDVATGTLATDHGLCVFAPDRVLTPSEAVTVCRVWAHVYELLGVRVCPNDGQVVDDEACDDCDGDCVPDYRNERVAAITIRSLTWRTRR